MATRRLLPPPLFFRGLARNRPVTPLFFSYSTMASPATKKALIPIANGTEPIEAVITIDVLRRAGADVTVASVEQNLRVDASLGIKLVADALVVDCEGSSFDLISLPGGLPGADRLRDCGVLESIVKKHVEKGGLYAAICAAPAIVLGSWGLLKGLKATCYPSVMDKMPSDVTKVESRVIVDGRAVTSRGPGTAIEFALALVEQLYGKDKAEEVAGSMKNIKFQAYSWLTVQSSVLLRRTRFPCTFWIKALLPVMRPNHDEYTVTELNSVAWKYDSTPQILVPIANGSEEMEALIIIDVLRRATANVVVASIEEKLQIIASRKVKIVADVLLDEAAKMQYDLIVLPGGLPGAQAFSDSEKLVNLLKKQAESNKLYGAICASPAIVLEPHGLLKGKKATAFPALCNKLGDPSESENRVLVDGNLITSRGPGTALEFALGIVEKLFGREKALELAKVMVFP